MGREFTTATFSVRSEVFTAVTMEPSSETLRCVDFVRTVVSEEIIATIIRVTEIGELKTTLAVSSNRSTL
jgi:hypothetical protein